MATNAEMMKRAYQILPGASLGTYYLPERYEFVVKRGAASRVYDVEGRGYIDYVLGSGPMVVGHALPEVVAAAQDQVQVLPHAMGDAFFHPGRVEMLERIAGLTGLDRAILGCSGADLPPVSASLKS